MSEFTPSVDDNSGNTSESLVETEDRAVPPPPERPAHARPRSTAGTIALSVTERYALVGVLIASIFVFYGLHPAVFLTKANLIQMANAQSTIVLLGIAVTITLRLGDLDLSFGATAVTTAVVIATLSTQHHVSMTLSIIVGLGFAALTGLVNAFLVVGLGLSSFVATLGTMTVVQGIGYGLSGSSVIAGISPQFTADLQGGPGGLPWSVIIGWILVVAMWLVYEYTPYGRYLAFIGGNRDAARLVGVPVARIRVISYALSGLLYGAAGTVLLGAIGSADPTSSAQYLLPPLAGAFLGTTAFRLGRFNAWGTLVGVYFLAVVTSGLALSGVQPWIADIFNGGAMVVAIAFSRLVRRRAASSASPGL